jgi:hypothetical protein
MQEKKQTDLVVLPGYAGSQRGLEHIRLREADYYGRES